MRWRPTLGLIVILSLVILIEGVVTVGRIVLRSGPSPTDMCSLGLAMRANRWCELEYSSRATGRLPTADQFTSELGAQRYAWQLGPGQSSKIIDSSAFTIFVACIGSGRLEVKVYAGDTARYDVTFGCVDVPQTAFTVPAQRDGSGAVYPGPYVISAAPIGSLTAAEYFVR
jgi:hypothetical protein